MNRGYVKLWRCLEENPILGKADHLSVWINLLLLANHKDKEWIYKGNKNICKAGQLITSRKSLAKKTNISESKIERILKYLEIEQQIEQQNLFSNRLISIKNWDAYQQSEQQSEQPVNSQWTASEQPVNTNKNEKNERMKELKKYISTELLTKFVDRDVDIQIFKITQSELDDLILKLGEKETKEMILEVELYCNSKGKRYKNYYMTVLSWSRNKYRRT